MLTLHLYIMNREKSGIESNSNEPRMSLPLGDSTPGTATCQGMRTPKLVADGNPWLSIGPSVAPVSRMVSTAVPGTRMNQRTKQLNR